MKQYVIDANKVVLNVPGPDTRVDDAEFEENEVYAIDIVTSTGEGKVIIFPCMLSIFITLSSNHFILQPEMRHGILY